MWRLIDYKRIGVICHREHANALQATMGTLLAKSDHFFGTQTRGSNEWHRDCDCLLVIGTPRVNPTAIADRLSQMNRHWAVARPDDWLGWGSHYWAGQTQSGERRTIQTLGYRDHDWIEAYEAIVHAELRQAAGRGRSLLADGVPVVVVTCEDLGYTLDDREPLMLTPAEWTVLNGGELLSTDFTYLTRKSLCGKGLMTRVGHGDYRQFTAVRYSAISSKPIK